MIFAWDNEHLPAKLFRFVVNALVDIASIMFAIFSILFRQQIRNYLTSLKSFILLVYFLTMINLYIIKFRMWDWKPCEHRGRRKDSISIGRPCVKRVLDEIVG